MYIKFTKYLFIYLFINRDSRIPTKWIYVSGCTCW